jgi:hypothetical protein
MNLETPALLTSHVAGHPNQHRSLHMKTEEILSALNRLSDTEDGYEALEQIRKAAEEIQARMKSDAIKRAEAMGIRCDDGNGRKQRKPRAAKQDHGEIIEQ